MHRIVGWLAAAVITTVVFASVYLALQQMARQEVNIAPAAAAAAQAQQIGSDPATGPHLELTKDSGLFLIVYGGDNKVIHTTVALHGEVPNLPVGVLEATRARGTDAVTWEPEPGLRMAIVSRDVGGKVVVAGQSLTPYEAIDKRTQLVLAAGWLASMVLLGVAYLLTVWQSRRRTAGSDGRLPEAG